MVILVPDCTEKFHIFDKFFIVDSVDKPIFPRPVGRYTRASQ